MSNDNIKTFSYLKGTAFTNNLKLQTQCKDYIALSNFLNIPKSTFSTWNAHNRTSHELIVRLHLSLGIPVKQLALPRDYPCKDIHPSLWESHEFMPQIQDQVNFYQSPSETRQIYQHATVILQRFSLKHGALISTGESPYAAQRMHELQLKAASTIEVETTDAIYLIDQHIQEIVAGRYLMDIDGRIVLHTAQRLPEQQIRIMFPEEAVSIDTNKVRILGRVVLTIQRS
ncbi:helix-turn-helix domain-containing protein [Vibrio gazogenes]|uniref:Bacteriophage CI repressor helix-turn-helix domain-containing protein n=1 Tax=Vibrio gazogenes DSM 21264 = NBRC 103151 TaxID=1123492 RepID=A0A1M4TN47_VIBGA|nr:helix-turn-helix domain-containing protein [Vibrio gazogenes]USP16135.1 helix-turn-helix domain-containing protein [Vibrio gazogenes]SHE45919.1 Bacteriophage CI repressor helix-turn-helix domain-containing protein [Vibrio gazogenes DSM 21264] [Vibrio gazogenes DSM 21264 = NBRC 103151]SJN52982.1 Bacteriophage CI repressor helix-turn-helix domain protein [Vibrio gazogenes]